MVGLVLALQWDNTTNIILLIPRGVLWLVFMGIQYEKWDEGTVCPHEAALRPAGLCSECEPLYNTCISRENHIHAISGMPQNVIQQDSVNIAAGIRRVAALAAKKSDLSGSACCQQCACKLGAWADRIAYKVLVAMMASEPSSSPQEWMLENYLVICATLWPASVITILSGFDLVAKAKFEPGAMGERDAVDC